MKPTINTKKAAFKRTHLTKRGVRLIAVTSLLLGLLIGRESAAQPIQPTDGVNLSSVQQGSIVAYHENEYQLHALNLLIQRDQVEQWACLWALWTGESNWRNKAHNKSSGAYGIAQFMPQTWEIVGYKKTSDGFIQVEAGLAYIDHRYAGSPCKAYAHFLAKRWY